MACCCSSVFALSIIILLISITIPTCNSIKCFISGEGSKEGKECTSSVLPDEINSFNCHYKAETNFVAGTTTSANADCMKEPDCKKFIQEGEGCKVIYSRKADVIEQTLECCCKENECNDGRKLQIPDNPPAPIKCHAQPPDKPAYCYNSQEDPGVCQFKQTLRVDGKKTEESASCVNKDTCDKEGCWMKGGEHTDAIEMECCCKTKECNMAEKQKELIAKALPLKCYNAFKTPSQSKGSYAKGTASHWCDAEEKCSFEMEKFLDSDILASQSEGKCVDDKIYSKHGCNDTVLTACKYHVKEGKDAEGKATAVGVIECCCSTDNCNDKDGLQKELAYKFKVPKCYETGSFESAQGSYCYDEKAVCLYRNETEQMTLPSGDKTETFIETGKCVYPPKEAEKEDVEKMKEYKMCNTTKNSCRRDTFGKPGQYMKSKVDCCCNTDNCNKPDVQMDKIPKPVPASDMAGVETSKKSENAAVQQTSSSLLLAIAIVGFELLIGRLLSGIF